MASNDISSAPVAVITGGARGIGLAVGEWFLAQGHRVSAVNDGPSGLDDLSCRLHDSSAKSRVALRAPVDPKA